MAICLSLFARAQGNRSRSRSIQRPFSILACTSVPTFLNASPPAPFHPIVIGHLAHRVPPSAIDLDPPLGIVLYTVGWVGHHEDRLGWPTQGARRLPVWWSVRPAHGFAAPHQLVLEKDVKSHPASIQREVRSEVSGTALVRSDISC